MGHSTAETRFQGPIHYACAGRLTREPPKGEYFRLLAQLTEGARAGMQRKWDNTSLYDAPGALAAAPTAADPHQSPSASRKKAPGSPARQPRRVTALDAFQRLDILEPDVPGGVESLDTRGHRLVVGTSDGQLLLYRTDGEARLSRTSLAARRGLGCGRKSVERVAFVGRDGPVLALCDGAAYVVELRDGEMQEPRLLPSSKGATCLGLLPGATHEAPAGAVCLGLRRRLHLYLPPSPARPEEGGATVEAAPAPARPDPDFLASATALLTGAVECPPATGWVHSGQFYLGRRALVPMAWTRVRCTTRASSCPRRRAR